MSPSGAGRHWGGLRPPRVSGDEPAATRLDKDPVQSAPRKRG